MNFANDTFTGTVATNLESHTSDSGHAWTALAIQLRLDGSGGVYGSSGSCIYTLGATPPSANYKVSATLICKSNLGNLNGIMIRCTDSTHYYLLRYNQGNTHWELYCFHPSAALLGSFTDATFTTAGQTRAVTLYANGTTISADIGGTVGAISATDSNLAAAGNPGLNSNLAGAGENSATGVHYSAFSASALSANGYTLTPSSVSVASGQVSPAFTITSTGGNFDGVGTITLTSSVAGDTITPSVGSPGIGAVTFTPTNGTSTVTVTVTPSSSGDRTITPTNSGIGSNPSAVTVHSKAIACTNPGSLPLLSAATLAGTATNVTAVDIDFSNDNGATWVSVATNVTVTANAFSTSYTPVGTAHLQAKFRATENGGTATASSTAFAVTASNYISTPVAAGWAYATTNYAQTPPANTLTWTNTGTPGNVDVLLSSDGGATFPTTLAANLPNVAAFSWCNSTVGYGTNYVVRVRRTASTNVYDQTAAFTISDGIPTLASGADLVFANEPSTAAVGSSANQYYNETPAIRWGCAKYDVPSAPFVTFVRVWHANGISKVSFSLDGGTWVDVIAEKLVAATTTSGDVAVGYFVRVDPTALTTGTHKIRAIAYPATAGTPIDTNTANNCGDFTFTVGVTQVQLYWAPGTGSDANTGLSLGSPKQTYQAVSALRTDTAKQYIINYVDSTQYYSIYSTVSNFQGTYYDIHRVTGGATGCVLTGRWGGVSAYRAAVVNATGANNAHDQTGTNWAAAEQKSLDFRTKYLKVQGPGISMDMSLSDGLLGAITGACWFDNVPMSMSTVLNDVSLTKKSFAAGITVAYTASTKTLTGTGIGTGITNGWRINVRSGTGFTATAGNNVNPPIITAVSANSMTFDTAIAPGNVASAADLVIDAGNAGGYTPNVFQQFTEYYFTNGSVTDYVKGYAADALATLRNITYTRIVSELLVPQATILNFKAVACDGSQSANWVFRAHGDVLHDFNPGQRNLIRAQCDCSQATGGTPWRLDTSVNADYRDIVILDSVINGGGVTTDTCGQERHLGIERCSWPTLNFGQTTIASFNGYQGKNWVARRSIFKQFLDLFTGVSARYASFTINNTSGSSRTYRTSCVVNGVTQDTGVASPNFSGNSYTTNYHFWCPQVGTSGTFAQIPTTGLIVPNGSTYTVWFNLTVTPAVLADGSVITFTVTDDLANITHPTAVVTQSVAMDQLGLEAGGPQGTNPVTLSTPYTNAGALDFTPSAGGGARGIAAGPAYSWDARSNRRASTGAIGGLAATTEYAVAPTIQTVSKQPDGTILVTCGTTNSSLSSASPLLTGFSITDGGAGVSVSSAYFSGPNQISIVPASALVGPTLVSYSGGNVTDDHTTPNALAAASNVPVASGGQGQFASIGGVMLIPGIGLGFDG
ncbi:MAG: hypothetical protein JWO57_662 [Pseudonocardiales bacterium]|nr:hypothetical protein [Pseudonocardiales bacterium]